MEGFRKALNDWIQVESKDWISQALLKALKNDEDLWKHFSEDFNKLNRDSQKALLYLTDEIGSRLSPTRSNGKLRVVEKHKIFWEEYNLVNSIDTTDVLSISEEEIDGVLTEFENKMKGVETKIDTMVKKVPTLEVPATKQDKTWGKEIKPFEYQWDNPTSREINLQLLEEVDMNNLPTWAWLKALVWMISQLDWANKNFEDFIMRQLNLSFDWDYEFSGKKYQLKEKFDAVKVQWSEENTARILEAYFNEFHLIQN